MRKIKEVLRLKYDSNLSGREISRSCQVSRSTVADYLMKAKAAGISWPEALSLTDTQIEERLFPTKGIPSSVKRPEPDYEYIYGQLRTYHKFNLTMIQLWLEYKEKHPDGYQYSQYCDLYRRWRGKLDYVMRQEHRAGEKAFIDYSDGLSILELATGKTGAATADLVEKILPAHTYPEQGYRACLGIIRLGRHYEPERVEAAAGRALKFNACSYRSMKAILTAGLDRQHGGESPAQMRLPLHQNIRGREYYQ